MEAPRSRLRSATLGLSVLMHLGFAGSVMWFDLLVQLHEEADRMPHYQLLMLPKPPTNHKTLYHDFRKPVPEVAPDKPFGASKSAQGERDALVRTLIAQSLNPASSRQFIWQPKHPEPIPVDIPAPNVASLPPQAAPSLKAPLKLFTPPPAVQPKAKPILVFEPPPPLHSAVADLRDEHLLRELSRQGIESAKKPPLKQFVPPPATPKIESGPAKMIEPPSVPIPAGAGGAIPAVIVGLNPTDRFSAPIPLGSRSAQFARAPAAGSTSSGAASSPDAPRVPGVTAHAPQGQSVGAAAVRPLGAVPERRVMSEVLFPPVNRSMSAPLRPSSRVVPATVEAKFAGRDVFVIVIPRPILTGYSGDWVLWFAPHQPENGVDARIQAPIPARKEDLTGEISATPDSNGKGSVQFQAVIDSKGSVLSPQILRGLISEPFRRRAVAELRTWEFKPSLRNGDAIEVDVVLEIPFEFRAPTAQTH